MTIPSAEIAAAIEVPGLNQLKRAVDPALSGMPDWLHSMVWATLAMLLLYVVLLWLLRHGLPWASTTFTTPVRTVVETCGIALLLPGYLASTLIRRLGGRVPGVMFMYDDLVQSTTRAAHWTAAAVLRVPFRLRKTSKSTLAVALIAVAILWDVTYCTGAGQGCTIPTTQWMNSVSRAFESPERNSKPKPCPTKQKRDPDNPSECVPKKKK